MRLQVHVPHSPDTEVQQPYATQPPSPVTSVSDSLHAEVMLPLVR